MRPLFSISALIFLGTAPVGVSAAAPVPQRLVLQNSGAAAQVANIPTPPSRSAIVAACADLVQQGSQDVFKRYEMMNTLVHLCGGPSAVAPKLVDLMQSSEPATRSAAAGAAGLCEDIGFEHISSPPTGAYVLSSSQSQATTRAFQVLIVPALAVAAEDRDKSVRLAALKSLEAQTEVSLELAEHNNDVSEAVWRRALPALAHNAASSDRQLRLAALRVLAYMPADASSFAASLRPGLQGNIAEQNYALAALCHAAQQDRSVTVSSFLRDLVSADLSKRRRAAADIHLAAIPLFSGEFHPDPDPLPNWYNDPRLFMSSNPNRLPDGQRQQEIKRRSTDAKQAQGFMLQVLAVAAGDSDASVRKDVAGSFEKISKWTTFWLGMGVTPNVGVEARSQVVDALAQAADAAQSHDAQMAAQLRTMQKQVTIPRTTE